MTRLFVFLGVPAAVLLLAVSFVFMTPLTASAHNGEDHSEEASEARLEKMEQLLTLLQQLVTILTERVGGEKAVEAILAHHHAGVVDHTYTELTINVEMHGGRVHVHVYEPGANTRKFFIDNVSADDENSIVEAIVEETALLIEDVVKVIDFSGLEEEEEHDHEEDEHEDDDHEDDLDGIHIMADGTIMLGNGEEVEGATITDDDMIMLSDGTIVEPEFDLR